jgi:hypothetical protein
MVNWVDLKFAWIATLLLLAGVFASAEAAQTGRTKAAKSPPATADPGPWLLAGREGKCAPLSILARKGRDFSNVHSPYQLVEKLRAKGHKAEIKEYKAGTRPAVEVRAPSAGLYVMFVKKEFCDKASPPAEIKK